MDMIVQMDPGKKTLKNGPPGRVGSPPRAGEEGDFVMEGRLGHGDETCAAILLHCNLRVHRIYSFLRVYQRFFLMHFSCAARAPCDSAERRSGKREKQRRRRRSLVEVFHLPTTEMTREMPGTPIATFSGVLRTRTTAILVEPSSFTPFACETTTISAEPRLALPGPPEWAPLFTVLAVSLLYPNLPVDPNGRRMDA